MFYLIAYLLSALVHLDYFHIISETNIKVTYDDFKGLAKDHFSCNDDNIFYSHLLEFHQQ